MSRHPPRGLLAADFMARFDGKTTAERLAEYDAMLARIDGELAIAKQAPSIEVLLAARGDSKEQP